MSISEKHLITLEFDKIRLLLADSCPIKCAQGRALSLSPETEPDLVRKKLRRTTDALRLYDAKGMPAFGNVCDVRDICEKAVKGASLTPRELLEVAGILRSSRMLLDYIRANKLFDTCIDEIFERLIPNRPIEDKISRSIISEELIADDASAALSDIRRKIRGANSKLKETLLKYTSGAYSKYLQENLVTQRSGRYVIPVKAEHRGDVPGLIHDTSSSGATIFVEPMAVVDANNELMMLQSKEQHEIERILYELSEQVASIAPSLFLNFENICELGFIFACAALSDRMDAREPIITDDKKQIKLINARHPLISKSTVVPITVSIGDGYDTLIITGPNTGGKTVTLKTLGLLAAMAQSGLHIPCDEGSSVFVFDRILANIGDEQSIEQSLSTFSSHMVAIADMIRTKTSRSLVLFDELGAGTDPVEGAALAIAIIEDVRAAGALCASTTHYPELKFYALDTEGVCNASSEFDVKTLRPTYRLIIGTPGKSSAFEISAKLGIPENIISRAGELISEDNKRMESVIGELEAARQEAEQNRRETEALKSEYERFKLDAEKEIEKKRKDADRELERAKQKALNLVQSATASSDFIMGQLDKLQKQRDSERLGDELERARKEIREHLRVNQDKFDPVEVPVIKNYVLPRKLRRGDEVYIVSLGKRAVVIEDPDRSDKVSVQAGIIKTKVKISDLQLLEESQKQSSKEQNSSARGIKASVSRDFRDEIDLRGMTTDEAWCKVDKYFDEAMIAGFHTVRLIHGKGTGALKNGLWKILRTDSRVRTFRIGQFGEGDGGVTVVELK